MSVVAHHVEPLIPLVSELKEALETMKDAYVRLPHLIEREHRAIKSGIFSEVQTICEEKQILTQGIEAGFEKLTKISDKISALTHLPIANLREAVVAINSVSDSITHESSLAHQVLRHVSLAVERSASELEEQARKAKPVIESNRDLVTQLMHSYSQSYRFWQEIQEQISSSYTPDGTQKVTGRISGFRARA